MNLLDIYTLANVETLKLAAELHRGVSPNEQCQARIELKLAPQTPVGDSLSQLGYVINTRLFVLGLPPNGREEEKLFTIDVVMNAIYRPIIDSYGSALGDLSFEQFNAGHTALTRQLLPILERRAHQMLLELGLTHIRLPMDLVHENNPAPSHRAAVH
jgi:hypothetical protein